MQNHSGCVAISLRVMSGSGEGLRAVGKCASVSVITTNVITVTLSSPAFARSRCDRAGERGPLHFLVMMSRAGESMLAPWSRVIELR